MKRTWRIGLLAAVLLTFGCPRNEPGTPLEEEFGEDLPIELLSSVNVADPRAEEQLVGGFHDLEQRAWRWTAKQFTVLLQPPPAVAGRPYTLDARLTIPGVVIEKLGPVTLTASIGGVDLAPETFSAPAENVLYSREIPAEAAIGSEPVEAVFRLDKAIAPGELDSRELGVVALSFALK
ncbi:MAG: hypothetical protein GC160_19315 [Acidobacteria bacterium]|nr:hypothetical protein [Acidobacteriota bacterium]